jgi:hypothetical protein
MMILTRNEDVRFVRSGTRSRPLSLLLGSRLPPAPSHRGVLAEWSDPGLVEPRGVAVAGRSRAPVVNGLHRQGEVINDLTKIHSSRLRRSGMLNRRIHGLDRLSPGQNHPNPSSPSA